MMENGETKSASRQPSDDTIPGGRSSNQDKKEDSPHKATTSQPKPISAPPKLYAGLFFYNDPYANLTDSPRERKEMDDSVDPPTIGNMKRSTENNKEQRKQVEALVGEKDVKEVISIKMSKNSDGVNKMVPVPEGIIIEQAEDANKDEIQKSINKLLSFEEQKTSPMHSQRHSPHPTDGMPTGTTMYMSGTPRTQQQLFAPVSPPTMGVASTPMYPQAGYNQMFVPYGMPPNLQTMGEFYSPDMYHSGYQNSGYKSGNKSHSGAKRFQAKSQKKQSIDQLNAPESQAQDDDYLLDNAANFLAKDQGGCRRLQRRLENDDEDGSFRRRLFERIADNFDELMMDPFGNYLCQKVIESAQDEEMEGIFRVIGDKILDIAFDCHGTRALQKLIELVKTPHLIEVITNQLKGHVIELVQDNNGNHVIQKCLNFFESPHNQFIYDEIRQNVVEVATHKHGCCVIQRCLDHSNRNQLTELVNVIVLHTLELVQDQYGNYVVQYVLDLNEFIPQKEKISTLLAPHLLELSKQKFASNVIEKCLRMDLAGFKASLTRLLSDPNKIAELLCDDFANYVIQSCLQCATDEERKKLIGYIKQKSDKIKNDELGNKIYVKLAKSYDSLIHDTLSGHKEGGNRGSQSNKKGGNHSEKSNNYPHSGNGSEGKNNHNQKSGKSRKYDQQQQQHHQQHEQRQQQEVPPFQLSSPDGMNYPHPGGFPQVGFPMQYPVQMPGYFPPNFTYAPSFMMNNQVINQYYNVPQQGYQKGWNYQKQQ